MASSGQRTWFSDGLRFECTRCGRCCGGVPGYVWVTDDEVAALARRLGLSDAEFRRRFTRRVDGYGVSLTETRGYDCTFFSSERGCTVYADRPRQCRTYPFWSRVVASPATWENETYVCPGMNQGRIWGLTEIRALSSDDGLPGRP